MWGYILIRRPLALAFLNHFINLNYIKKSYFTTVGIKVDVLILHTCGNIVFDLKAHFDI